MTQEPPDQEYFYLGNRTTQGILLETLQTDVVVTTLHPCWVQNGNSAKMEVEYEARTTVNIQWQINGTPYATGYGKPSTGSTWMKILEAGYKHNNNKYTVVIKDDHGNIAFTSGKLNVY